MVGVGVVGLGVGLPVGATDGLGVGPPVGAADGLSVGAFVGARVGAVVGAALGAEVGAVVGGGAVGAGVGTAVPTPSEPSGRGFVKRA